MSDEELGLDNFIERDGNDTSITVTEDSTGKEVKILLEQQPTVIRRVIVYRGTTYFHPKDLKQVVKPSWLSDLWPPEAGLLRRARDHGVEGVAKLLGHRPITSIEEMRDGLTLPGSHLFRSASRDAPISSSESQSPCDAFSIICRPSKVWRSPAAVRETEVYRQAVRRRVFRNRTGKCDLDTVRKQRRC
jgi:hypothetical protein